MADQAGIPLYSDGGYIAVHDNSDDSYFIVDNMSIEYDIDLAIDGITLVDGLGFETGMHKNNVVNNVTISLPEDNPSSIETAALTQNNAYDLWIRRSAEFGLYFDMIEGCIFRGIKKAVEPSTGKARRVVVMFEKGTYYPIIEPTTDLIDYLVDVDREDEPP